ncbi:hypothetical protein WJX75_008971 [Coccomyxa subellipsoidea]|uniref:Glutaredoxin-like protein n=1 Tax=Coccomyxa subellipsoidea TaxID=248742 RepID=A0ABR2YLQ4_9CHLO
MQNRHTVQAFSEHCDSQQHNTAAAKAVLIRDITTEPAWWEAYSLTIPVLTFADADGSNEVKVPRPSPRMSTDRLGQHLEKALESKEQEP